MTKQKNTDIDDFDVPLTERGMSNATSRFESYQFFKEIFAELPKSELVKRGWINDKNDMSSLMTLFEEIHSNQLRPLFRKADNHNEALCAAWLSRISSQAQVAIASRETPEFKGLTKGNLSDLATLSVDEKILLELPDILANHGIVLIYEKSLPGMKLDGVVFKSATGNPVIGMSFRYPRLDNFWFTLMHELSHVVLHFENLDSPIFDDLSIGSDDVIEIQANRLAKDSFVKKSDWRNCPPKYDNSDKAVIAFAKEQKIHPSIIAGMLQKEHGSFDRYRKIVDAVDTRKLVFGNG